MVYPSTSTSLPAGRGSGRLYPRLNWYRDRCSVSSGSPPTSLSMRSVHGFDARLVFRQGCQIRELVRIVGKVIELPFSRMILVDDGVIDVLPVAGTNHHVSRSSVVSVVLAHCIVSSIWRCRDPSNAASTVPFQSSGVCAPANIGHGLHQVHMRGSAFAPLPAAPALGPRDHQGNPAGLLKHAVLPPHAVLAHVFAMIGRVDDDRVFGDVGMQAQEPQALFRSRYRPVGETIVEFAATAHGVVWNADLLEIQPAALCNSGAGCRETRRESPAFRLCHDTAPSIHRAR